MAQVIDINGVTHQISDNEINRGITVDRLLAMSDSEADSDEKELLKELADWLSSVMFA